MASRPICEAQNVGTRAGRDSRGKSSRQRSERIATPAPSATAARIQPGVGASIALRTSWKSSPRIASQPKTTETAMPTTAANHAPHALTVSRKRYLTRAYTAGKPSRQVIFLPSS